MRTVFDVVRHIGIGKFEFHIRNAAVAIILICVFDRQWNEVGFDIGIMLGRRLRISDDQAIVAGSYVAFTGAEACVIS